jgi:TrpR family trp operon transcriptional repressor
MTEGQHCHASEGWHPEHAVRVSWDSRVPRSTKDLKKFLTFCAQDASRSQFETCLDLLLTPEEKEDIIDRLRIIRELLLELKTQREISADLNVSIAKITRGSNALKRIDKPLKQSLKEILK